jgi:hypothetical protein
MNVIACTEIGTWYSRIKCTVIYSIKDLTTPKTEGIYAQNINLPVGLRHQIWKILLKRRTRRFLPFSVSFKTRIDVMV